MAVYSTNQNRHLFVAKAYKATVDETSDVGTIGGVKVVDGGLDKELYFMYRGVDGIMKSDRIQLKNFNYAKAIAAENLQIPMKRVEVTLDSEVNGGNPVASQDYILRIEFRNWCGAGDDVRYFKDGAVHATSATTPAEFYKCMKQSLDNAFSREPYATRDSNPYLAFILDDEDNPTKLIIEEKPQPWVLGTEQQERVYFEVQPTTIYTSGDDFIWGKVEVVVPVTKIGNGKQIADLEWFCMGERGDQYRMKGWPNYIATTYLVDPSKEYNVLELHFAFTDEGVSSYRSEKDITIVSDDASVLNSLIGDINTAAGINIETL